MAVGSVVRSGCLNLFLIESINQSSCSTTIVDFVFVAAKQPRQTDSSVENVNEISGHSKYIYISFGLSNEASTSLTADDCPEPLAPTITT